VIKRSISGQEEPGARYDAYKVDYGCYVDLLATTKAPTHQLFDTEEADEEAGASVKVNADDIPLSLRMPGQFCANRISINTESGHGLVLVPRPMMAARRFVSAAVEFLAISIMDEVHGSNAFWHRTTYTRETP
jgi:hypothetical protein